MTDQLSLAEVIKIFVVLCKWMWQEKTSKRTGVRKNSFEESNKNNKRK